MFYSLYDSGLELESVMEASTGTQQIPRSIGTASVPNPSSPRVKPIKRPEKPVVTSDYLEINGIRRITDPAKV